MARTCCPHCFSPADWIDTLTTKCPECLSGASEIEKARLVSRQTADGINAYLRGKEARRKRIEREVDPLNEPA